MRIVDRTGGTVCERCRVAESLVARTRGLLGRSSLDPDEGLLIRRTSSVHTHFMRFPIDVVFLDAEGAVLRIVHALRPWRLAGCRGARDVVELAAGTCDRLGLREGAHLSLLANPV
jgi:uncharacterized membrane protein (UPF0127 family)